MTEDTALIPRSGMFLEYQAMAKQDGQKSGVSGIPILTIPEFTRLIREMFPTSQLINDAQGRQVYSGIKMRPKTASDTKKLIIKQNGIANGNGEHFKVANGRSGESLLFNLIVDLDLVPEFFDYKLLWLH